MSPIEAIRILNDLKYSGRITSFKLICPPVVENTVVVFTIANLAPSQSAGAERPELTVVCGGATVEKALCAGAEEARDWCGAPKHNPEAA
jgi:hypothetical protein